MHIFNIDAYRECFDIVSSELDEDSMFRFGVKLNLPAKDVDEICNRNIRKYPKIYQLLTLWQEKTGLIADLAQIIIILKDMNKNSIAEKLFTKLHS